MKTASVLLALLASVLWNTAALAGEMLRSDNDPTLAMNAFNGAREGAGVKT